MDFRVLWYFVLVGAGLMVLNDAVPDTRQEDHLAFWAGAGALSALFVSVQSPLRPSAMIVCGVSLGTLLIHADKALDTLKAFLDLDLPLMALAAAGVVVAFFVMKLFLGTMGAGIGAAVGAGVVAVVILGFFDDAPKHLITQQDNLDRLAALRDFKTSPDYVHVDRAARAAIDRAIADCAALSSSAFLGLALFHDAIKVSPQWKALPRDAAQMLDWYHTQSGRAVDLSCRP